MRMPVVLALLAGLLAACSSPPNHYFMLSAQSEAANPADPVAKTVALGEIKLPGALDRPQIARRLGPNQLEFAEYDRWAGPLDQMIRRVLSTDLRARLPAGIALIDNDSAASADVTVAIDIARFDADKAGRVTLEAGWEQLDKNGRVFGAPSVAKIVEPGAGADTAAVAATMSRAVAALAERIAPGVGGASPTAIR
jgi:uncharacterized protein